MIDDLAALIAARLDEDEDQARDLARGAPGPWSVDHSWVRDAAGDIVVHDEYHWSALPHIARHDPARALRDIAAKRAILAEHLHLETEGIEPAFGCRICHNDREWGIGCEGWCLTVRQLAAVYSDHPDYRPEWAP